MLDISKLERRWLIYKIKKILPYALLIAIVVILLILLPLILSNKPSPTAMITLRKETQNIKPPIVLDANNDTGTMVLEPSMHFIESIDAPSISVTNTAIFTPPSTKPVAISKTAIAPSTASPYPSTPVIGQSQVQKPQQPLDKGKLTTIKRDDTAFDIHVLEDRFKDNSNPNLGVYIAKYHYDHGNYSEAYNYALKTNSINNNIDDSWLIFAKSLVKLGKEAQARKTLQLYISNSNSQNAKNYLDALNNDNGK